MDNHKKILIFIDWFFPGYKAGGPITSIKNLIEHLSSDFEFLIITRNTDYLDSIPYKNVISDKWIYFKSNVKIFYLSSQNTNIKYINHLVRSIDFDLAYVNGIYSFYFSILPLFIIKKKIIVCARGMFSEQSFARKNFKKKLFISFAKFMGLYKHVSFHATNESEKTDISALFDNKNIFVVPNLSLLNENYAYIKKETNELKLVSIARISQEKNTKFALEILSQINHGKIVFDIYGSIYDEKYWVECQNIIERMPKNITVNYKGSISSERVIDTFNKYHFSFMPSIGENFGHSIIESMLSGTPVITSNNTPWRNLQNSGLGWDIDLKEIQVFVDVINKCVRFTQNEYDVMSKKTFEYANSENKNNKFVEDYLKMFKSE